MNKIIINAGLALLMSGCGGGAGGGGASADVTTECIELRAVNFLSLQEFFNQCDFSANFAKMLQIEGQDTRILMSLVLAPNKSITTLAPELYAPIACRRPIHTCKVRE